MTKVLTATVASRDSLTGPTYCCQECGALTRDLLGHGAIIHLAEEFVVNGLVEATRAAIRDMAGEK